MGIKSLHKHAYLTAQNIYVKAQPNALALAAAAATAGEKMVVFKSSHSQNACTTPFPTSGLL